MIRNIVNKGDHFGWPSIIMHWLSAVLVAVLFGLGLYMVELTYYDPLYRILPEWHKVLGLVLAFITLVRLFWLLPAGLPEALPDSRLVHVLAKLVHLLMYLALLLLPVSGYLITTADGAALSLFGALSIPALVEPTAQQAELLGDIHRWLAYFLVAAAVFHGGAAIAHHFVFKDTTLVRMLNPYRFPITDQYLKEKKHD